MDLNNPEQIKQLIDALQKLLPKEEPEEEEENPVIKTKTRSIKSKKSNTKNKFLDMPEKNMHKEDIAIDKLLSKSPPTPRTREFVPVSVRCRVCGKKESVNPLVIPDSADRYKCNKCASSSGG